VSGGRENAHANASVHVRLGDGGRRQRYDHGRDSDARYQRSFGVENKGRWRTRVTGV